MNTISKTFFLLLLMSLIFSCKDDDDDPIDPIPTGPVYENHTFGPSDTEDDILAAFISITTGDTITFEAGNFEFTKSLSLLDTTGVVIVGAGQDQTFLDFSGQIEGAEGIKADNCKMLMFANFTIRNTAGDAIKATDCDGLTFYKVTAEWTGEVSSTNGAYGLYPVQSKNVLLDGCTARGASDAGLYIGQCENAIVKNCVATENVAGIEIENTINADVFNNQAINNTGGILIFDLPGLEMSGSNCRVFDNEIRDNSHENFASAGVVGVVPPGTGLMVLSTKNVEVFNNTISNNNVMGIGIINYNVLTFFDPQLSFDDPNYDPFPDGIHIHDNTITRENNYPANPNQIGTVLQSLFPDEDNPMTEIIFDGIANGSQKICIQNNGNARFANLDAANGFLNISLDASPYDCSVDALPPVTVNAPTFE